MGKEKVTRGTRRWWDVPQWWGAGGKDGGGGRVSCGGRDEEDGYGRKCWARREAEAEAYICMVKTRVRA